MITLKWTAWSLLSLRKQHITCKYSAQYDLATETEALSYLPHEGLIEWSAHN